MNNPLIQAVQPREWNLLEGSRIERKIVGGEYDFNSNLLILDVQVSKIVGAGATEEIQDSFEKRVFEITSLKVTQKKEGADESSKSIELIGARTEEAMKSVMPQIIENFQQLIDPKVFLSRDENGRITKKTAVFSHHNEQDHLVGKALTFSQTLQNNAQGLFEMTSASEEGANFFSKSTRSERKENLIEDISTLKALLNQANWQSLIEKAESKETSLREWDSSKVVGEIKPSLILTEIVKKLTTHSSLIKDALPLSLFEEAASNHTRLEERLSHIESHIQVLEKILENMQSFYQEQQRELSGIEVIGLMADSERLREKISVFNKQKKQIQKVLHLQRDLAVMIAIREVQKYQEIGGSSPIGASLTRDWNQIVNYYGLALSSNQNDLSEAQREEHLEEHLKEKLGFHISFTNLSAESESEISAWEELFNFMIEGIEERHERKAQLEELERQETVRLAEDARLKEQQRLEELLKRQEQEAAKRLQNSLEATRELLEQDRYQDDLLPETPSTASTDFSFNFSEELEPIPLTPIVERRAQPKGHTPNFFEGLDSGDELFTNEPMPHPSDRTSTLSFLDELGLLDSAEDIYQAALDARANDPQDV